MQLAVSLYDQPRQQENIPIQLNIFLNWTQIDLMYSVIRTSNSVNMIEMFVNSTCLYSYPSRAPEFTPPPFFGGVRGTIFLVFVLSYSVSSSSMVRVVMYVTISA